ncbi:MAG: helix-turn-helix domain-containing protein [Planctomycetota bacterium]
MAPATRSSRPGSRATRTAKTTTTTTTPASAESPRPSRPKGARPASAGRYKAPALDRGLDILEKLADEPNGLSLKRLADALGRTPTEIFRMVVRLQERGYLRRGHDDAYHLTARMLALAHRHAPTKGLITAAMPTMVRLAERVGQSCHLAQLHTTELVVIAEVAGSSPLCLTVRPGSSHDPAETTSGRLLLALQDDPVIPEAERRRLRKSKVVRRASSVSRGVTDLSAPVFDYTGRAVGALTVPMLVLHEPPIEPAEVLSEVESAAARISDALGGSAGSIAPPSPEALS